VNPSKSNLFAGLIAAAAISFSTLALSAADTVIRYGKIYTMDPAKPWADAVAIDNGEIVFVGSNNGVRKFIGNRTNVINLYSNDMVLPGLHDVHMHPLEQGSDVVNCIVDGKKSVDNWLTAIAQCANTGSDWLLGYGFNISALVEDGRNPAAALDAISSTRPIAIMEQTSHAVWVNSRALELLGFDAGAENPAGGHIGRLANGEPNGILMDTAGDMAFHLALANPTSAQKNADYQGLLWSLKQIRKNGLTSIMNARVYWKREYLDAWYKARNQGKLTARTTLGLWYYPEDTNDDQQIAELTQMFDDSDPMMRVNQIKMYDDGISINTTAAMKQPYLKDLGYGLASNNGLNYLQESRMGYVISELEKVGFDMTIHAIGDRGVHEALNAIEYAQGVNGNNLDRRHRLTHVEHVDTADMARFDALDVIADAQVAGDWSNPQNHSAAEIELLGHARMDRLFPLKDLHNANATLTLSSDWGVSTLNPFVAMEHALTRGDQSLPNLHTVLEAYTINAAYALKQENLVGSIKVGKRADLTIVDRNLFNTAVKNLSDTKVVMTVVDGKIVYELK
jgi:predicted amidohydrolase YtcJ